MSTRTKTTATFSIRIKIPTGQNAQQAQLFLRNAILILANADQKHPFFGIRPEDFTVALTKKETTYGP